MGTLALFPLNPFLADKIKADSCLEGCAGGYKLRKSCWWTRACPRIRDQSFLAATCALDRALGVHRHALCRPEVLNLTRIASTGWLQQNGRASRVTGGKPRVWDYRPTRLLCTSMCRGLSTFLTFPDTTGDKMSPFGDLTGTDSPRGPSAVH